MKSMLYGLVFLSATGTVWAVPMALSQVTESAVVTACVKNAHYSVIVLRGQETITLKSNDMSVDEDTRWSIPRWAKALKPGDAIRLSYDKRTPAWKGGVPIWNVEIEKESNSPEKNFNIYYVPDKQAVELETTQEYECIPVPKSLLVKVKNEGNADVKEICIHTGRGG